MPRTINAASFSIEWMNEAWNFRGYYGAGNTVGLLDSLHGRTAIVAGAAEGVFDEVERASQGVEPVYFAANDVGVYLPFVDHLVSLHSDNLVHWAALRADKRQRLSFRTHSLDSADYNWEQVTPVFALSGYFAMQIAWLMGCEKIILCGCPGDNTRRFFDARPRENWRREVMLYQEEGVLQQLEDEMRRLPDFKAAVRSMSGFTKDFFGAP